MLYLDYSLSLARGPLNAGRATEVLTGVLVGAPAVNANGGFDGYVPLPEVAAYAAYIVRLE